MSEVELTSELVIAQISGMQDKKKSIDQFYRDYDNQYGDRDQNERRFRSVIDVINETFDGNLSDTEFSRVPLFYTIYCAIYHYQYGLPHLQLNTPRKELSKAERLSLADAAQSLSDLINTGREGLPLRSDAEKFVRACLRQTDNINPRRDRLTYFYEQAFAN